MPDYSYNQIKQMEQEATRRAREMARLSKPLNREEKGENCEKAEKTIKKSKGSFGFLNALDIKKLIGENSEQALLLLLIIILSNDENCDEFLLYALIYVML